MQLAEALTLIIAPDGSLLDAPSSEALARLDATGCFSNRPELRFIIQTALRSHAFRNFASLAEGSSRATNLINHFIAHTGFRTDLANEAFTAFACAMGWTNLPSVAAEIPPVGSTTPSVNEPPEPYTTAITSDNTEEPTPWHELPLAERIRLLNEHLTLDTSRATTFGATADNPQIVNITPAGIILTCTLRRITPMGAAQLHYSLYCGDALLSVGEAGTMSTFATDRLPIQFTIPASSLPTPMPTTPLHIHLFIC